MPMTEQTAQGFTLLEVLVAMTLVALGTLGNFALFSHSFQQHSFGLHVARAADIAASLHAELRAGQALRAELAPDCVNGELPACDALQWRRQSLHHWQQQAASRLPTGHLQLASQGAQSSVITLSWRDPIALRRERWSLVINNE